MYHSASIARAAARILPPAASALLHSASMLGIGRRSVTDLPDEPKQQ